MDAKKLAGQILKEVGGKENIKEMFHCVTRLRFYLKDRSVVDLEKVKALDGVIGAQFQAEQFQVIIGNEVNTVHDAVLAQTGFIHNEETMAQKKKFRATGIFETMAAILLPVIPALAGAGMIKGLITILTSYCGVDAASDMIQVLTIARDCVFYFLPFLVAWSASRRFKTDTACAMALAGSLLYPTMTTGLAGIAPLANYISRLLVMVVRFLYHLSPVIAGAIVGGTRLLVVLTGMHMSLSAICLENLNQLGYDFLLPMNTMGTLALFGVCMGVMVRAKKSENRSLGASTAISAFIGITEPGIYGIVMKFRNALIAAMIAGAAGGAIVGAFGGRATSFVNSCILSLPVFMGEGFWAVCLGMAVAAGVGFVLVMVMGISEDQDQPKGEKGEKKEEKAGEKKNEVVYAPITGNLIPLSQVKDEVFSSGAMGKGIAIDPEDGTVTAPFDGTVVTVYPTKHAIGLISESGTECIIHIGIDTANLQGKYYDVKVTDGQKIKAGDILAVVDLANIIKEGYSLVTPVLITNSADYLDVLANETGRMIAKSEPLLTIIK